MTPSQYVISHFFGGVRPMARTTEQPVTTIDYWWRNGIPQRRWEQVIGWGKKIGVEIKMRHFLEIVEETAA